MYCVLRKKIADMTNSSAIFSRNFRSKNPKTNDAAYAALSFLGIKRILLPKEYCCGINRKNVTLS